MRFHINLPSSSDIKRILPAAMIATASLGNYDEKENSSGIEPKICNFPEPGATRSRLTDEFIAFKNMEANRSVLNSFRSLEKGWNGYSGLPISDSVIKNAEAILANLGTQPEVFPTGRGTIQFEYENGDNYFEVEINDSEGSVFFIKDGSEKTFKSSIKEIPDAVKSFLA